MVGLGGRCWGSILHDEGGPLMPVCGLCEAELVYIANLKEGADNGFGRQDLYQCPVCKTIAVKVT